MVLSVEVRGQRAGVSSPSTMGVPGTELRAFGSKCPRPLGGPFGPLFACLIVFDSITFVCVSVNTPVGAFGDQKGTVHPLRLKFYVGSGDLIGVLCKNSQYSQPLSQRSSCLCPFCFCFLRPYSQQSSCLHPRVLTQQARAATPAQ